MDIGDPGAYGTFTLWNTQLHELYSPFKAHTKPMNEWGSLNNETLVAFGMSATINEFKQWCGLVVAERLVLSNPHSS